MGTDSVKLFNKAVADRILAMEQAPLVQFLEENIDVIRNKECTLSFIFFEMEQNGGSVSDAIGRLLSGEQTFTELKADVAQDFGFGDEEIYLDYWACYSHVFNGHPEGSISSLGYLSNQEEEIFLLLRPEHVHQMLKSLDDHSDDLRVMKVSDIQRLERWRDLCAADPSYMVAYHFDY
jgi:hypothetical protein